MSPPDPGPRVWRRPGPVCGSVLLLILAFAAPLRAQVTDTLPPPPDTAQVADTTAVPPPTMPSLGHARTAGWATGVWRWDRTALLNEGAVSLLELLRRVPGINTVRTGVLLQPEAAGVFGGTGARLEVIYDGLVLDPLLGGTVDLSTIALVELVEVVVERRADLLRIRLKSTEPEDARPESRIEAAVGDPEANVFRGELLAPHFLVGPLALAIERVQSNGAGTAEPADDFAGWVKWSVISGPRGLQLELRQISLDRDAGSPWPSSSKRRDMLVRFRNEFRSGIVGEIYGARSTAETEGALAVDATAADSAAAGLLDRASTQIGARASAELGDGWVEGGLRWRNADQLPSLQLDLGGGLDLSLLQLRADLASFRWSPDKSATDVDLLGVVGPVAGLTAFAEFAKGPRGAPTYSGRVRPLFDDRTSLRLGGEANWRGISAGVALLKVKTDSVQPFALPFDTAFSGFNGGDVTGWELYGRVPLFREWLVAEGSFSRWVSGLRWAYLPSETGRGALEVHSLPLPSGNLEILARIEARRHGSMQVPILDEDGEPELVPSLPRTIFDAYLQIRILDLRMFIRFDDMTGQNEQDIRDQAVRGPRILYGVKWRFFN